MFSFAHPEICTAEYDRTFYQQRSKSKAEAKLAEHQSCRSALDTTFVSRTSSLWANFVGVQYGTVVSS